MATSNRVGLIGDYNPQVTAHIAIPKALDIAASATGHKTEARWIATSDLSAQPDEMLGGFDALWCVPASPYDNMTGALAAIRYARQQHVPFLGTCGGYQHAVLEFARTVLGHAEADNGEVNPDAAMPLIAPLSCALVEQSDTIELTPGSHVARLHGATSVFEKYHCSYGIAPQYLGLFDDSALDFTGFDNQDEPRAFEIKDQPFFIGTAYQPERSALTGTSHPLIEAFVAAAAGKLSLAV